MIRFNYIKRFNLIINFLIQIENNNIIILLTIFEKKVINIDIV